jgi:NTE family protein
LAAVLAAALGRTAAGVATTVLNAVFMDAIDGDLERLNRINAALALLPPARHAASPLRPIRAMMVSPSEDLGAMAEPHLARFPKRIRYLLRGLGADHPESQDFASYILFDHAYTRALLDLGERDAVARRDEIEALVREDREVTAGVWQS